MKSVLVILTLIAGFSASAAEADRWLSADASTEANVPECVTGNCPQKQFSAPWTHAPDTREIDAITKADEVLGKPSTTKGTR